MRRRDFIVLIGGATAASWPHAARTQQRERMRLIGVLMGYAESDPGAQPLVAAFRDALPKLGRTEGRNVRLLLLPAAEYATPRSLFGGAMGMLGYAGRAAENSSPPVSS
jgi:hypothetical protein